MARFAAVERTPKTLISITRSRAMILAALAAILLSPTSAAAATGLTASAACAAVQSLVAGYRTGIVISGLSPSRPVPKAQTRISPSSFLY